MELVSDKEFIGIIKEIALQTDEGKIVWSPDKSGGLVAFVGEIGLYLLKKIHANMPTTIYLQIKNPKGDVIYSINSMVTGSPEDEFNIFNNLFLKFKREEMQVDETIDILKSSLGLK